MTQEPFADRIRHKLQQVRARGLTCFGANGHHFQLNLTLSEDEVLAFEQEHGVELPADYRMFLTQVGNGGAGPYYGLYPLEKWNAIAGQEIPGQLASVCPILPEHADGTNLSKKLNCEWEDCFRGTIALCNQGCTYAAAMIVTGPHRGQIVYFNEEGPACYFIDHTDFISWYERWLDELLAEYNMHWFGFGKAGDERTLAALLNDSQTNESDLVDSMTSLSRIPALADSTLSFVTRLLSHDSALVRSRAASLLDHGAGEKVAGDLCTRLVDADPTVRKATLSTLAKIHAAEWEGAARAALNDESPSVVSNAARVLDEAGRLTVTDLQQLIASTSRPRVETGLFYWGKDARRVDNVEFPFALLSDSDVQIRRLAIGAARELKLSAAIPILIERLNSETDSVTRGKIARVLLEMTDRRALPALLDAATSDDDFTRYHVAHGLRNFKGLEVIRALNKLAHDHTTPVRKNAEGFLVQTTMQAIARVARESRRRVLVRTFLPFLR